MNDAIDRESPTSMLKNDHRMIERVLRVLETLVIRSESGRGLEKALLADCVEFFRLFADACHHAREEEHLFPVLEQRGIPREGGPIGVMLYEHQQARELTRQMAEALASVDRDDSAQSRFRAAARQYLSLLTNHIHKEDNILFRMGDQVMSSEDRRAVCARFCEASCMKVVGRNREELEAIADRLERDLSQLPG